MTALVLHVSDNKKNKAAFIQLSAEIVGMSVCYTSTNIPAHSERKEKY